MAGDYGVDPDQIVGYAFEPLAIRYTERDASLYALGVGAPADPLDQDELRFVYELSAAGFRVLPTFAVTFPTRMIDTLLSGSLPGLRYNPMLVLHGEQMVEVPRPLPAATVVTARPKVAAVYDKGSGALVVIDVPCYDENEALVALNRSSMFIRGIGGFGGERGPSSETNTPPARPPDAVISERTLPQQALLYRLSGDINPLHADPLMAGLAGFDRPILHGLCTFGYAARAVLRAFCQNDPARFLRMTARFASHVFPGEMLVTEMWHEGERVLLRTSTAERGDPVLTHAAVDLQ